MNAETLLQEILTANEQSKYEGLDRSAAAVKERRKYQHYIQQKNTLEGIENPSPESLEGRLITHFIAGDISAAQMIKILQKNNSPELLYK